MLAKWVRSHSKEIRVYAGWLLFIGTLLGWPASVWLTDEPVFILSLSWMAILIESWNMIQIAEEK